MPQLIDYSKALGHSLARIRLRPAIWNEIAVTEVNDFEIGYGKWEKMSPSSVSRAGLPCRYTPAAL